MSFGDVFDKCKTSDGYFGPFRVMGDRYYTLPVMESVPGTHMKFQGEDYLMWSVNNYLGLAENDEIKKIAEQTVKEWGVSGPMGSRMMSGNTPDHVEFEKELADFAQKEHSILFNFGYLGVTGTIQTVVGPDDVIVMDKLDHASIVDGVMGAISDKKQLRLFKHNNMENLEDTLKRANEKGVDGEGRKGGVIIVTEGVYGMTGDLARLDEICALKEKYEARLFIDDAHGIGVMGENGRGTAEHFGVQDKVDLYFGTFAKAFASIGGFTAGAKDVVEWIRYNARTQVFAKSLPMVYVRALRKTLELVQNGKDRRERLFSISRKLSTGLRELGFYVGEVDSPIVPVFIAGDGDLAVALGWIKFLREHGIFVTGVVYPVIPMGVVMFRIIPTASHTEEDVEMTLKAFQALRDDFKMNLHPDLKLIERVYGKR